MSFIKKYFANQATTNISLVELRRNELTSTTAGHHVWFVRPVQSGASDEWGLLIQKFVFGTRRGEASAVTQAGFSEPSLGDEAAVSSLSTDGCVTLEDKVFSLIGWTRSDVDVITRTAEDVWKQVATRGPQAEQNTTQAFLQLLAEQLTLASKSSKSFDYPWFELNVTTPVTQVLSETFPKPNQVAGAAAVKHYNKATSRHRLLSGLGYAGNTAGATG